MAASEKFSAEDAKYELLEFVETHRGSGGEVFTKAEDIPGDRGSFLVTLAGRTVGGVQSTQPVRLKVTVEEAEE
ncbi:hypothetical protein ACQPZJ_35525 [Actinoplanes sp. CA-054009]